MDASSGNKMTPWFVTIESSGNTRTGVCYALDDGQAGDRMY